MIQRKIFSVVAALSFVTAQGLDLNVESTDSIKSTASTIAGGAVSYYKGNGAGEIPGILPEPYYWWTGGALFDTLIQYWHLTGDTQYNGIVSQAIQFQQGMYNDFMPINQSQSEGNDDQSTWALAAMSAAESRFPEAENGTTWLSLAETVFNEQVFRWDAETCDGGLRWQVLGFNVGYNYKNSPSNGNFFQLATRLARYTGNSTYSDWASTAFDWSKTVGLIDDQWNVYDGSSTSTNCSAINRLQFSNAAGTYIAGAAHMYNITAGNSTWKAALDGLLNRNLDLFFPGGIATEISCEAASTCSTDMTVYKGLLGRWLIDSIQMAPYTSSTIMPKIKASAQAAASACNGDVCSLIWSGPPSNNITSGLGEQLSALSFVQGLLVKDSAVPVTENTSNLSGSSGGTPTSTSASTGNQLPTPSGSANPATTANAGIVVRVQSVVMVAAALGSMAWLIL